MKDTIRKILREDCKSEVNEYYTDPYLTTDPEDKWSSLEKDIESCIYPILKKHVNDFGDGSYGVINAMYDVLDKMFQKV